MRKIGRRGLFRALASLPLLTLSGCSALGALSTVSRSSPSVRLAGRNIAYGTEPRQTLDIYAPPAGTPPTGTLVFVYGGSWNSGSKGRYGFAGRAFAGRGFLTMVADYRLVPDIRYPAFVEDVAKAVAFAHRHAQDHGDGSGKLFLAGHSAGAYNALMVALAPEFLRAEGLSPMVLDGVAGISGPYDFLPLAGPVTRAAFGGYSPLLSTQPIKRAQSRAPVPPIMLATGDADRTVNPANTRKLAAVLRNSGHWVEEKHYPGAGHTDTVLALSPLLRSRAPVLDDVTGFFARQ